MEKEVKKPWESKTMIANVLVGVSPLIPQVHSWISQNPEGFGIVVGLLNLLLRSVSEKKISFSWPL